MTCLMEHEALVQCAKSLKRRHHNPAGAYPMRCRITRLIALRYRAQQHAHASWVRVLVRRLSVRHGIVK